MRVHVRALIGDWSRATLVCTRRCVRVCIRACLWQPSRSVVVLLASNMFA